MREDNVRKIWSEAELDAALEDLNSDVTEDDDLAFARASLLAAAGVEQAPPAEPRRAGAWRWLAVAAAVVTLVGGLGVAAALWTPDPPETSRPAGLTDVDRPLAPGEFHYTEMRDWSTYVVPGLATKVQRRIELWIPADPTGVWHRRTTVTGDAHGSGELLPKPVDEYGPAGVFPGPRLSWLTPDAAFIASLVPDRQKLAQRLSTDTLETDGPQKGRAHSATEMLGMVRSVLETGLPPRDVRSALLDALANVPGIYVAPHQATPDQQPATVYAAKDTGRRLFVDPATARLVAADSVPTLAMVRNKAIPLTTSLPPPSSVAAPNTTTTKFPVSPQRPDAPDTLYSYAITRTSG
ncbi:CU044_5270 family protein [Amycolatopsis sp. Hca4]|uniref:CU044_5270 family protein n=1 Tax=Amycolatopsis sp. Hca4 TaxID=2742131 RepID=UPI001590A1F3|nr:CU044_5270 family protein [Amycolatopsis sp. Hca4]QKV77697.1 CU044_5270 family protein [Amycolatopsis sp. Hca4]